MHKHLPTRWDSTNAWYFVTVVTHERYPYFESEEACRILMDACRSVRERQRYRLGALIIMPDHWHALIKPHENEVIESIVGSIKQKIFHASRQTGSAAVEDGATIGVTPHLGATAETNGSAAFHGGSAIKTIRWQKRFMDHRIRNEKDYFQHLEYMRLNPYRKQLVKDESEGWQWWFEHKEPFC